MNKLPLRNKAWEEFMRQANAKEHIKHNVVIININLYYMKGGLDIRAIRLTV